MCLDYSSYLNYGYTSLFTYNVQLISLRQAVFIRTSKQGFHTTLHSKASHLAALVDSTSESTCLSHLQVCCQLGTQARFPCTDEEPSRIVPEPDDSMRGAWLWQWTPVTAILILLVTRRKIGPKRPVQPWTAVDDAIRQCLAAATLRLLMWLLSSSRGMMFMESSSWKSSLHAYGIRRVAMALDERQ